MRNLEDILINAGKVMNKVESGSYQKGHINQNIISKSAEELIEMHQSQPTLPASSTPTNYVQPASQEYVHKVNESRLPDHIKALMLENPITPSEVPMENTLDLNFATRVAEKMQKMDFIDHPKKGQVKEGKGAQQQYTRQPQQQVQQQPQTSGGMLGISEAALKELKPLIEHIVETSIEKILEQKLKENDAKTSKLNESLQIRVGDYIFTGKITGSKSVKK